MCIFYCIIKSLNFQKNCKPLQKKKKIEYTLLIIRIQFVVFFLLEQSQ